jgi:hypothetical protein
MAITRIKSQGVVGLSNNSSRLESQVIGVDLASCYMKISEVQYLQ